MTKSARREIKKINKRIEELKEMQNNNLEIQKYITKDEIYSIINSYEGYIEYMYRQEGHT